MKKVLFSVLFAASAAMGLSACMNGDYDANPNGTNSGPNPLNTGGNGGGGGGGNSNTAAKGEVRFTAFGSKWTFTNGTCKDFGTNNPRISANYFVPPAMHSIGLVVTQYTTPKTYTQADGGAVGGAIFLDASGSNSGNYSSLEPGGAATINVSSVENNEMKGTFSFTAFVTGSTTQKIEVTEGSFYVPIEN